MAVTANQTNKWRRDPHQLRAIGVAATKHIYEGTIVYLTAGGFATDVITSAIFWGIAKAEADNSSGADGDIDVEVWRGGTVQLPMTGAATANIGDEVEGVDNYEVQALAVGPRIGTVVGVPASGIAEVELDPQV